MRTRGLGFAGLVLIAAHLAARPAPAQAPAPWTEVPFDSERWERAGVESTQGTHLGRPALLLRRGLLWLPDADFVNGEIEFDISFSGQRGFVGAAWRIQDERNLEHFYLRPHRSQMPDACQYTPVDHGSSAWQLLPQSAAAITLPRERWLKVRLVVWENVLRVHVDSPQACLTTPLRRAIEPGGIGIQVPGFEPAHFTGFRYRELNAAPAGPTPEEEHAPSGSVMDWSVSGAFAEELVAGRLELPGELLGELAWSPLAAEANGLANLARLQAAGAQTNTCLARLRLSASEARPVSLAFGFSDRVRVFHDGRLVYAGDDGYLTRDHRFLGTIGLHDSLGLQLHAGTNEILFAVSETFGGWGLMAVLEPAPGVSLLAPVPKEKRPAAPADSTRR